MKTCIECLEEKPESEFMESLHRPIEGGFDTLDSCRDCIRPLTALDRVERWYKHCQKNSYKLKEIWVHPSDAADVGREYYGLPVKVFGSSWALGL